MSVEHSSETRGDSNVSEGKLREETMSGGLRGFNI